MIIDEDPVDHSFTSRLAEASPVLSSKPNNESEKDITTNGTIDAQKYCNKTTNATSFIIKYQRLKRALEAFIIP